jgi:hypothetical protein
MPDIAGAGAGAADKGKGALTHKIGPLPLWGWAVAGVAAVFVGLKLRGASSGSSAGPGLVTLPAGTGTPVDTSASAAPPIVNPAQNVIGGMDTAPGGTAPWWVSPPQWWNATPGVALTGNPSTNGSAGSGSLVTTTQATPTLSAPSADWWTKLTNPMGNIPAGAAVTTIGGTVYSLSDAALGRAGITGAVPVQNAASATATNASAPTGGGYQGSGMGAAALRNENIG